MSTTQGVRKVYRGYLSLGSNGEDEHVLRLGEPVEDPKWLAEAVMEDIEKHGNVLTVRYFITKESIPEDMVIPELLKTLAGWGDAKYAMVYTEMTGYIYTEEDLLIGGHDLLAELKNNLGKFCQLEIQFNRYKR
jgi:hypothetical protein